MSHGTLMSLQILLAGVSTLAIYSFLIRENSFYRFFEHLFIGIATSITVMQTFRNYLWAKFFRPMLGMDRMPFPDGSYPTVYNNYLLLYLIPICIGLLYYTLLSRRHAWMAQPVIGLSLGASAGLAFKGIANEMIPQIIDSFRPLYIVGDLAKTANNLVFLIVLLCVFSYFFFTFRNKTGGAVDKAGSVGRWMMMGCFGAYFGSTIMARMALLVERLEFLINTWIPEIARIIGGGFA
ncbi:MAG: hypothetical protein PHC51_08445, partial [bacterium]|nr:hypothetical protein [bacterium]